MKTKAFYTFLLALVLTVSLCMPVFASPDAESETAAVSFDASGTDNPAVQGDSPAGTEAPDGEEQAAEDAQEKAVPEKSNNTPFFIGAGFAVLLFLGVALYCKANGNKMM